MEDKIDMIEQALKEKACLKQKIYRLTADWFKRFEQVSAKLVKEIDERISKVDENVEIALDHINEFEFRIRFSGDMLIFTMHSNIVTFPDDHVLSKSPYVIEDGQRGYFGQVMVHNFMADSVRYQRLGDIGYLLARLMINVEEHFYIEGVRPVSFLYPDIAKNQLEEEVLRLFVEDLMLTALSIDLQAASFHDIQIIDLGTKLANQMVTGGEKVGFQMSSEQN